MIMVIPEEKLSKRFSLGGITMRLFKYISVIAIIASIPFFLKAFALFNIINNANRDGDGIGLYFLGLEINDRLRYEQIPSYSGTFLVIGLLLVVCSIVMYVRTRKQEA